MRSRPTQPGAFPFYALLTLSGACILLGTLPIMASLGLVRGSAPSGPVAAVIAFLFGAVFAALGTVSSWLAIRPVALAAGATTLASAGSLAWRALARRADARTVLGAVGVAVLALAAWLALADLSVPVLADRVLVMEIFTLEFLLIHGFVFFAFAAGFAHERVGRGRALGIAALVMLTGVYGVVAWFTAGGIYGLAWLVWLTAPNVLAFARDTPDHTVRVLAVSRWAVKFFLFIVLAAALSEGGDVGDPAALPLAAVYFTVLTVMELLRVPEIPLDLADAWRAAKVDRGGSM